MPKPSLEDLMSSNDLSNEEKELCRITVTFILIGETQKLKEFMEKEGLKNGSKVLDVANVYCSDVLKGIIDAMPQK